MLPNDVPLYNEVALGVNAPMYAYSAQRILTRAGIRSFAVNRSDEGPWITFSKEKP